MVQYLIIRASRAARVRSHLYDYELYRHQDSKWLNAILTYSILFIYTFYTNMDEPLERVETCRRSSVLIQKLYIAI